MSHSAQISPVTPPRSWWKSPLFQLAVILLALTAAYSGSLNAAWHFDDPEYVLLNPAIRSFKSLSEIRVPGLRKLFWASLTLCYKASERFGVHFTDNPDVRIFRAWNIGCHFVAAWALFGLLRRIVRVKQRDVQNPDAETAATAMDLLPLLAAALFAAHPLTTEAVTYISGRGNSQGGMFYLLGLYGAALTFERLKNERAFRAVWPALFCLACGTASVMTKESHLSFPVAVALLYWTFYRGSRGGSKSTVSISFLGGLALAGCLLTLGFLWRQDGWLGFCAGAGVGVALAGWLWGGEEGGERGESGSAKPEVRRVGLGWALLVVGLTLLAAVFIIFPFSYQRLLTAFAGEHGEDPLRALASQVYAVPMMLLKALVPLGLNIDHDFPTYTSLMEIPVLLGAGSLVLLVGAGLIAAWRGALAGFFILLALVSIIPTNLLLEREDIASERNFYLSAACGAVVLAWLVVCLAKFLARGQILQGKSGENGGAVVLPPLVKGSLTPAALVSRETLLRTGVLGCALVLPFIALCQRRNAEYAEELTLWSAAVQRAPKKIRALHNYGLAAAKKDLFEPAEQAFRLAISTGEERSAKGNFRPDENVALLTYQLSYADLGALLFRRYQANPASQTELLGQIDQLYRRGIKRTASNPEVAWAYARFLLQIRQAPMAARLLEATFRQYPWAGYLLQPLGTAELQCHRFAEARRYLLEAFDFQYPSILGFATPTKPQERALILCQVASAELGLKQKAAAVARLRAALELEPAAAYAFLQGPPTPGADALAALREALGENPKNILLRQMLEIVKAEQERRGKAPPEPNPSGKGEEVPQDVKKEP